MTGKRKLWSYSAGRRPFTVWVGEWERDSNIYVRIRERYRSLGHRDRQKAIDYAERAASRLREGAEAVITTRVTLERLFRIYRAHRTPQKSAFTQVEDERRFELFQRVFGAQKNPYAIGVGDWDRFIAARRSGAINGRGEVVPERKRRPVRARTIEADLGWLSAVFNWAQKWRTVEGERLLRENPAHGLPRPRERNPRRPIASRDRVEKILAVSDQVMMDDRTRGRRERTRSYLTELVVLAQGTGRRISAICQLRHEDLRLDQGPHGAIRWPASTDKMRLESTVPIGPDVRAAIDRILEERPGIGKAYLFPSPLGPGKPIRYELASEWLMEAEKLAGVPKLQGGLWHPLRRLWATERKHLPDVDVAAAGGWADPNTLRLVYQQPDEATMLRVVLEAGQLREQTS